MKISELKNKFVEIYGRKEEDLRVFSSPGRVNLIGEHTDYNGGFVFPAALTLNSTVVARPRKDRCINLYATDLGVKVEADMNRLEAYKDLEWGSYQLGVAFMLQEAGYRFTGCDMLYFESVPFGAGLSSSAAIEVVTALALATFANETDGAAKEIDLVELALLSQKAENEYVGVNCGIMDQFASAMGKKDHAILLNCKNLEYELVPLRLDGYRVVISNTNKKRGLADSKYNERREECDKGFEILKTVIPEADCLGDISNEQFKRLGSVIEDGIIRKRVEHVISEDDRVLKSATALKNNDIEAFGRFMTASHQSLRDLYEVTGAELDTLVEETLKVEGVLGSRMTGAGFGGCTVSIVKEDAVDRFIECVGKNYYNRTGLKSAFYISEIGDGAREEG